MLSHVCQNGLVLNEQDTEIIHSWSDLVSEIRYVCMYMHQTLLIKPFAPYQIYASYFVYDRNFVI